MWTIANKYNKNGSLNLNYTLDRLKDNCIHTRSRLKKYYNLQYDYFVTFTFAPSKIDYLQNDKIKIQFELQEFFKSIKNLARYKKFNYYLLLLPDFASIEQGIHFHGLLKCSDYSVFGFAESGHYYKSDIIYNISFWEKGYTTAIHYDNSEKAKKYICKYISKYKNKLLNHRYYFTTNLKRKELFKKGGI